MNKKSGVQSPPTPKNQLVSWSDDKRVIIRSGRHRLKLSLKKKKKTICITYYDWCKIKLMLKISKKKESAIGVTGVCVKCQCKINIALILIYHLSKLWIKIFLFLTCISNFVEMLFSNESLFRKHDSLTPW